MRRKRSATKPAVENKVQILFPGNDGGYVMKWLVKEGDGVDATQPLCRCFCEGANNARRPVMEVVAPYDGTITSLELQVDEKVAAGASPMVARMSYCLHDQVFNGLCCVCGRVPSQKNASTVSEAEAGIAECVDPTHANTATITVNIPGGNKLQVSRNQAEDDRKNTVKRLFKSKKLLLVLDLDNTLLHATDDPRAPAFAESKGVINDLHTFKLGAFEGYTDVNKHHFLMLRPGVEGWLATMSTMYELYIYTAGTRVYAEAVAKIMDPSKKLFGDRIISRTDVPELGKIKRLDRFFPVDNSMVLALDDRSDVWAEDAYNLLTIRPYRFFENMREMNQAPELNFEAPLETTEKQPISSRSIEINLKRTGDLLTWIHTKFYCAEEIPVEDQLAQKGSDVKELLRKLRLKILRDTNIVVNMSTPEQNTNVFSLAAACGASCSLTLTPDSQLVITNDSESPLTIEAKLKLIWVVRPEWLYACIHNWHREPQGPYSVFVLSKNKLTPPSATKRKRPPPEKFDDFGYPVEEEEECDAKKANQQSEEDGSADFEKQLLS